MIKNIHSSIFILVFLMLFSNNKLHAQEFEEVYAEKLIPFCNAQGKWGYLDATTRQTVIAPQFDRANLFNVKGIAKVANYQHIADNQEDVELIGWIDTTGKELFRPQFTYVTEAYITHNEPFDNTIEEYKQVSDINGNSGVINMKGDWLVPLQKADDIKVYNKNSYLIDNKIFYNGGEKYIAPNNTTFADIDFERRWFYLKSNDELKQSIVTWEGKTVVPNNYFNIEYHPDANRFLASKIKGNPDLTSITGNEKVIFSLLNDQGKEIKSYEADYLPDILNEDQAAYRFNTIQHYIRLSDGAEISEESEELDREGYYIFFENNYFGLKTKDRKITIPAMYATLTSLDKNYFLASKSLGEQLGVVDMHNKTIIPFSYEHLFYAQDEHLFIASQNGKYGALNEAGNIVIPFQYDYDFFFNNGTAQVHSNGKKGIINTKGETIIPIEYDDLFNSKELSETEETYYSISKNKLWGLADSVGKIIVPLKYGYLSFGGIRLKGMEDWIQTEDKERKLRGLYNFKTKVEIPAEYDYATVYQDAIIVSYSKDDEKNYQLFDHSGNPQTTLPYSGMLYNGSYLIVQINGKYGLIDAKGKTLLAPNYDYIWGKSKNLVSVRKDHREFYVNTNGTQYVQ